MSRDDVDLPALRCEACRVGSPVVTDDELAELMPQIPEWSIVDRDGVRTLERAFTFDSYAATLDFAVRVGQAAEAEDHHPAMLVEWGRVIVTWWTHKIHDLHKNDLIMAARTDRIRAADQEP